MIQGALSDRKLVSIICPVFNEEQSIPIFYDRLQAALAPLRDHYDFELIFTNNRSADKSLEVILSLRERDSSVQVLTMSRNFGYQASIQAGISCASGDGIIVIDVDCEDPPELVPQFVAKWEEGYDVVYGIRGDRPEWWGLKKARKLFYHLLQRTADMDIVLYMAEFALISSHVRDAVINNQNTFPFFRAEIGYAGFSRYGIPYDRQPRIKGKSHYNLMGMVSFAVAGLLTSSTFLFRLAAYIFPVVVLLNLALFLADMYSSSSVPFRALVAIDLVYTVFLLTIQGLYLARVYKNAIGRPVFIVDRKLSYIDNKFPDERSARS